MAFPGIYRPIGVVTVGPAEVLGRGEVQAANLYMTIGRRIGRIRFDGVDGLVCSYICSVRAERPQRDLNPCFQDENLTSWTELDDGVEVFPGS